jgi:hypothetical protein
MVDPRSRYFPFKSILACFILIIKSALLLNFEEDIEINLNPLTIGAINRPFVCAHSFYRAHIVFPVMRLRLFGKQVIVLQIVKRS